MPLVIDSAPDCVVHKEGYSADDIADFVLQNDFKDCAGFGTFMPGSTYGDDGTGAETIYMILTWVGIVVMVVVLVAWVLYENRRIIGAVAGISAAGTPIAGYVPPTTPTTPQEPPPQPGMPGGV
jgi:hypothetical protein